MKRTDHLRRYAALALLALIVPSLLAACGGSSAATATPAPTKAAASGAAPTTGAAATTAPAAATTTAGSPAAAATTAGVAPTTAPAAGGTTTAAKPGGQLVIGRDISDLITLDPGHTYEISTGPIMAGAYETLVTQAPPDITKFTAVLAKDVPTAQNGGISADGKTYTFKLRDNVKFHTGNTMTADDWVFSLTRLHYLSDNPSFLADPYSTEGRGEYQGS